MPESPHNWVTARADCFVDMIFKSLRDIVDRDVRAINAVDARKRHGWEFRIQKNDEGTHPRFAVIRNHPDYPGITKGVFFDVHATSIRVTLEDDSTLDVVPEWDEHTSACKTKIGGVPHELWQISEKALSRFFFGRIRRLG